MNGKQFGVVLMLLGSFATVAVSASSDDEAATQTETQASNSATEDTKKKEESFLDRWEPLPSGGGGGAPEGNDPIHAVGGGPCVKEANAESVPGLEGRPLCSKKGGEGNPFARLLDSLGS